MAEGEAVATVPDTALTYPFDARPAPGEAIAVAPGVLWMRLPLPMALDHVNVWAIADGEGWVVVDTGLKTPVSVDAWEAALAGPLAGRPVTRVICTHMHPDHIGLAGRLCARFDAPLLMSRLEYVTGRMLISETGPAPEAGAVFYRRAGWTDLQIEAWRKGYGRFGSAVEPLPHSFVRLSEGETITIGGDDWRIVIGDGHSPEHVCLWRQRDGVFIAGDQILPRISSNISVWPTEPAADPLGDWLSSIAKLRDLLPADLLVLPSHGEPFRGVHGRLDALARGHATSLKRLERRLRDPARVVDVFPTLFGRPVGDGLLGMATGEAIAHLNHLERQGRVRRAPDDDGADRWTVISGDDS
ncbi:MAG: MBL fold metallo-hydrolase [Alphaproteobacteria bacterium]|nr:MBL fold metallo-hydrolase [Alphaproteobacteria bacterium]MBU1526165.1 MBL fold metallo-hydrolase [Alphaproteobacteria bacterium]MBU2117416.1 MBL fold metallo-hydrolase [Alphaproteobacteria bacterium]MBU2350517.1 MBL fold metallo-hydrolase [Alphaproteobacteria bacterium]MBU2380982.1 MBL fold metallo-hydrolase [Alphaproteobacteria bacterium]